MSWYNPEPRQLPKLLPRTKPVKSVPSGIGDKDIVGNWLMYYLKGGNHLHDFSPYNNHGEIKGAIWKDTIPGWTLFFDGNDDYCEIPHKDIYDLIPEGSCTLWAKAVKTTAANGSVVIAGAWSIDGWGIGMEENNMTIKFYDRTHGDKYNLIGFSYGEWYFIGVSKSDTTVDWVVYDGAYNTGSPTLSGEIDPSTTPLYFASTSDPPNDLHHGFINQVRIYERPLSMNEMKRICERTKSLYSF